MDCMVEGIRYQTDKIGSFYVRSSAERGRDPLCLMVSVLKYARKASFWVFLHLSAHDQ